MPMKRTDELRPGDVVVDHGMRIRIDERKTTAREADDLPVYVLPGTVLNLDEVRAARHVPMHWLKHNGRDDVWIIQGNRLMTWATE